MVDVSVIMPTYNMELYVEEAVNSILNQSFKDFEFIIVDDASTDNTPAFLKSIQDDRVICIFNKQNRGNYACRNEGLSNASGKYICVMDADDIAHPDRLMKQYAFMEENLRCVAVGSDILGFSNTRSNLLLKRLQNKEEIKVFLLKDNTCTHPSLIIRKEILDRYKIQYNEKFYYAADYNLIVDLSAIGSLSNLPEPLLKYRLHNNQITYIRKNEQIYYRNQIQFKQLSRFELQPSIEEKALHLTLMNDLPAVNHSLLERLEKWCNKLLDQNGKTRFYNEECLYLFLKERMMEVMKKSFRLKS